MRSFFKNKLINQYRYQSIDHLKVVAGVFLPCNEECDISSDCAILWLIIKTLWCCTQVHRWCYSMTTINRTNTITALRVLSASTVPYWYKPQALPVCPCNESRQSANTVPLPWRPCAWLSPRWYWRRWAACYKWCDVPPRVHKHPLCTGPNTPGYKIICIM